RTRLNGGIITGWAIALTRMHIGDSVRVVIPYNVGYGTSAYGNVKAYSNLQFELKLVGIPYYEAKP
ncbi:MAG: FKBP-type peptidyl-prolyl cis-trans isomerase, partial [Muribaculaceae bacterium]|nr:FKBP-type peptidyl-prolyl cis-trans isomerase [Muribaculaceae bacterium]